MGKQECQGTKGTGSIGVGEDGVIGYEEQQGGKLCRCVVICMLRTQRDNLRGNNATQVSSIKYWLACSLGPAQRHSSSGQSEHGLGGRAFSTHGLQVRNGSSMQLRWRGGNSLSIQSRFTGSSGKGYISGSGRLSSSDLRMGFSAGLAALGASQHFRKKWRTCTLAGGWSSSASSASLYCRT